MKFSLHLSSLDGTCASEESILKEFGFLSVNNAIANTVGSNANQYSPSLPSSLRLNDIANLVQSSIKEGNEKLKKNFDKKESGLLACELGSVSMGAWEPVSLGFFWV
jgi:hypothetical protein